MLNDNSNISMKMILHNDILHTEGIFKFQLTTSIITHNFLNRSKYLIIGQVYENNFVFWRSIPPSQLVVIKLYIKNNINFKLLFNKLF